MRRFLVFLGLPITLTLATSVLVKPALAEYANVNGVKMYYEVHGARPVVLLHGGLDTIENSFSHQINALAGNHKVIAIEQMGHGHTPDVAGRSMSYEQMAEDTAALLKQLGVIQADVIGWSDGGQIALRLAFVHPELVRRVVASGVGLGATPDMAAQIRGLKVPERSDARTAYDRTSPDGDEHFAVVCRKVYAMWAKPTWGFTTADLGRIRLPVMIVAGDQDAVPLDMVIRVFRAIPKAQLYILPGTGHDTFRSRPEWMNPVLISFIDSN